MTNLDTAVSFTFFADDTSVLWRNADAVGLLRDISDDLNKIKLWCNG